MSAAERYCASAPACHRLISDRNCCAQIDALFNLGNACAALGRADEAMDSYQRALLLNPLVCSSGPRWLGDLGGVGARYYAPQYPPPSSSFRVPYLIS